MSTKHDSKCLINAGDDEPIFVLRAQDVLAPLMVRTWAELARERGTPEAKVQAALDTAKQMQEWHTRKVPD